MKCELINECKFFKTGTGGDPACIVEKLKRKYCEDNPLLCARRRVAWAVGREKVPVELHPDHIHHALDLIAARHSEDGSVHPRSFGAGDTQKRFMSSPRRGTSALRRSGPPQ